MRRPIVAANFKMNMTASEVTAYASALISTLAGSVGVDVVVAPPFTAIDRAVSGFAGSDVAVAAQNVHAEPAGAFTGEVAAGMLVELGCRYGIVGHSERRALFAETDAMVSGKARALLAAGLNPIICVGESLEEREAGRTSEVVKSQLRGSLAELPADRAADLIVAYEPVWAIGTGRTATPEMAQEVHGSIRDGLTAAFGAGGELIRIQYGGSVKPENAAELMAQPDIDGALVGGASLDPVSFGSIVRAAAQPPSGR
jgi:triosephosphate isomerase